MTYLRESSRSEESSSSEYSKDRLKESIRTEHVERRWNSQDTEITTNMTSSIGENSEDDDGTVDDGDSPRATPGDADVDVEAEVDVTTPSTDADPSADHYTQAIMDVLCSEEIVKIVERAVHQELVVMRMDRGVVIVVDTAKPCVRSDIDDVPDVQDESSLKDGCNEQGSLQSRDFTPPHGNTIIQEESSSLPSMDESSLSESSKDSPKELPQAIGKNADNNDGVKISVLGWGEFSDVHDSSSETATSISSTISNEYQSEITPRWDIMCAYDHDYLRSPDLHTRGIANKITVYESFNPYLRDQDSILPSLKMETRDDRAGGEGETVTAEEKKEEVEEGGEEEAEVPEERGAEEEGEEEEPAVDVDDVARDDAATTKATDDAAVDGDDEEEEGASDIAAAAAADGDPDESTTKATTAAMTKKREKSSEGLPEGWIHRQVPRKGSDSKTDPYWFSPKLAYKFNSLLQVRRFLAILEEEAGGDEVAAIKSMRDKFDKRKIDGGGDNDESSVPKKRGPNMSSAGDGAVAVVATDMNDSKAGKRKSKKERGGDKTTTAFAPKKDGGSINGRKKNGGDGGGGSGGGAFVDADVNDANRRLLCAYDHDYLRSPDLHTRGIANKITVYESFNPYLRDQDSILPSLKMETRDDRAGGEGETVTAEEKKEEVEEGGEEEAEVPEERGAEEEGEEEEPAVDVDDVARDDAATTKATDDAAVDGDDEEEEGASDIAAAAAADGDPDESTTKATTAAMTKKREKSSEGLPEGWIHRQVPRKGSDSKTDPYWFSPKLAYKFNSLLQVRRFLAILEEEAGGDEVAAIKSMRDKFDKRKIDGGGDNDEGSVPKKRGPNMAVVATERPERGRASPPQRRPRRPLVRRTPPTRA